MEKSFIEGGVTGMIIYDTRRTKEETKHPVRFRITHKRDVTYISPGYYFTPDEFERLPGTREAQLTKQRRAIEDQFTAIKISIRDIIESGDYSHNKLKSVLGRGDTDNIITCFETIIKEMNKAGRIGNASIYQNTMHYLMKYDSKRTTFKNITPKYLEALQADMKQNITQSTASIYLRTIRSVFNWAIREKIIDPKLYPFKKNTDGAIDGKFKIIDGSGTKTALTAEQVSLIRNYEIPDTFPAMKRSRDLFLLMFNLAGISAIDLMLLKWKNINGNEIHFERKKTARTVKKQTIIKIPITNTVQAILDNYGTQDKSPDNYILPFMIGAETPLQIKQVAANHTRIMNKHLKAIADALKLPRVSTYVSRHSYATILKNAGISVSFLQETLGHSSLQTTMNYLKGFEQQQRRDTFENLETLINTPKQ